METTPINLRGNTSYNSCITTGLITITSQDNLAGPNKKNTESYTIENYCIICYNTINELPAETCTDVTRNVIYYNLKNQLCSCVYDVHFECLTYWLLNNPICPICRGGVNINTNGSAIKLYKEHNKINISINGDEYTSNTDCVVVDLKNCSYFEYIDDNDEKPDGNNNTETPQNTDGHCSKVVLNAVCHFIVIFIISFVVYSFLYLYVL